MHLNINLLLQSSTNIVMESVTQLPSFALSSKKQSQPIPQSNGSLLQIGNLLMTILWALSSSNSNSNKKWLLHNARKQFGITKTMAQHSEEHYFKALTLWLLTNATKNKTVILIFPLLLTTATENTKKTKKLPLHFAAIRTDVFEWLNTRCLVYASDWTIMGWKYIKT